MTVTMVSFLGIQTATFQDRTSLKLTAEAKIADDFAFTTVNAFSSPGVTEIVI